MESALRTRQAEVASVPTSPESAFRFDALQRLVRPILVAVPATGLVLGMIARLAGFDHWAGPIWAGVTAPVLVALLIEIVTSLRRGDVGLDVVAALSMGGALAFGEYLAAVVVALMYAGGQYLESFAERRASREMTALLSRVPRTALRHRDGRLEEVALGYIEPGDRLLVGHGDVVAVDGTVSRRVGDPGPGGADRRVAAGQAHARRGGPERIDERRRRLRPLGHPSSGREHLCRDRSARGGCTALEGTNGAAGGPVRHRLPGRHRGARGSRMVLDRRSDPRSRGAGRCHAMPADPRRSCCDRLGRFEGREVRRPRERRKGP